MISKLKEQKVQLVLQRSQAKDVVENCERQLLTISSVISSLEEAEKAHNEELNSIREANADAAPSE